MATASNATEQPDLTHQTSDYVETAYLITVCAIGIPLNLWVFYRLLHEKRRLRCKSDLNAAFLMLKLNLCVSDLLIFCGYGIGKICWMVTYQWLGGMVLCKLWRYISLLAFYISSNVIVTIAVDRYLNVRNPLRSRQIVPTQQVKRLLLIAWLLALVLATPQLFVFTTINIGSAEGGFYQCSSYWVVRSWLQGNLTNTQTAFMYLYDSQHLLLIFWVPLIALVVCYSMIVANLLRYASFANRHTFQQSVKSNFDPTDTLPLAVIEPNNNNNNSNNLLDISEATRSSSLAPISSIIADTATQAPLSDTNMRRSETDVGNLAPSQGRLMPHSGTEPVLQSATETLTSPLGDSMTKSVRSRSVRSFNWRLELKSRIFKTTALLVVAYVVCWAPYNCYCFLGFINRTATEQFVPNILSSFVILNSLINPLLYVKFR